MPPLTILPPEITLKIVSELDLSDVASLRQTCKHLHSVSQDRSIWLSLLGKQQRLYPIPPEYVLNPAWRNATDIEGLVSACHRLARAWPLPRRRPPVKAQPKMGEMLIAMEVILDRWLLIVYAEGSMFLWDLLPGPRSSEYSRRMNTKPEGRLCAVLSLVDRGGPMWTSVAFEIGEDRQTLIVALNSKPTTPYACSIYEVPLRHGSSFKHLKTIPLSKPETVRALRYSENMLLLSRGSSFNLVRMSGEPEFDLTVISPHSEDLEDMWNGTIDVRLFSHYVLVFKTRSIEIHDLQYLLEIHKSEVEAQPIAKHLFSHTTFRDVRFSMPLVAPHDLAAYTIHVLAYDVLQGLFHYVIHFQPSFDTSLPGHLTVHLTNIYALANHVVSNFSTRLLNPDLYTPSPTPSMETDGIFRQGINLSSRGFISAYTFGLQAKRAVWVERIRGSTIREVQVWSNATSLVDDETNLTTPRDIERIVVHSISSPDLREDIIRCALSESTGLIILGNRAGEVFFLGVDI